MTRRTLTPTGLLMVAIAALGVVTTDRATAGEPNVADMKVISSDATDEARSVQLGLNKSVVINLPRDIKDVLIAEPKIVSAVVRSKTRVYIIGAAVGRTNVFFFGDDDQPIGTLDINVSDDPQLYPQQLKKSGIDRNLVVVYRGVVRAAYSCSTDQHAALQECAVGAEKAEPFNTTHSYITINGGGASPVVPIK
jgi:Flp pilus assembly secretin CpaC